MKPRIAIFSLTGCEGCSLAILELEDQLLELLDAVDIVNFREGMSERDWNIDLGFVDGAVSTPADEEELRRFRAHCKSLVAIGACACLGGVNTLKNSQDPADYRRAVYGDRADWFPTTPARPLAQVVTVDYELPGCPMVKEEFLEFVKCQLVNRPFRLPAEAVCVECKKRGNPCLYDRGIRCLGPLTRAGCNAVCPTYGARCEGCRGLVSPDVLAAARIALCEQRGVHPDDLRADLRLFGAFQESALP